MWTLSEWISSQNCQIRRRDPTPVALPEVLFIDLCFWSFVSCRRRSSRNRRWWINLISNVIIMMRTMATTVSQSGAGFDPTDYVMTTIMFWLSLSVFLTLSSSSPCSTGDFGFSPQRSEVWCETISRVKWSRAEPCCCVEEECEQTGLMQKPEECSRERGGAFLSLFILQLVAPCLWMFLNWLERGSPSSASAPVHVGNPTTNDTGVLECAELRDPVTLLLFWQQQRWERWLVMSYLSVMSWADWAVTEVRPQSSSYMKLMINKGGINHENKGLWKKSEPEGTVTHSVNNLKNLQQFFPHFLSCSGCFLSSQEHQKAVQSGCCELLTAKYQIQSFIQPLTHSLFWTVTKRCEKTQQLQVDLLQKPRRQRKHGQQKCQHSRVRN